MKATRMIAASLLLLALMGCGGGGTKPALLPFTGNRTFQALVPAPEAAIGEVTVGFTEGARLTLTLQVADNARTLTGTLTSSDGLMNGAALQQVKVRENEFEAQVETTRQRTLTLKASFVAAQYAASRQGSLTVDGTFIADGIMFLMTVSDDAGHHQLIPAAGKGMDAPPFQTNDSAGNPVSLASFRGQKNVVLNFYRGKG